MNSKDIKTLLNEVKDGNISIDDAAIKFEDLPYKELGFAKIDNHRELRVGYPEVVYCEGKNS